MKTKQRFGSPKKFVKYCVAEYLAGRPVNPSDVKGNMSLILVSEPTNQEFKGKLGIYGTHIQAPSMSVLCASINKVLEDGGSVLHNRAYNLRGMIRCPIDQKVKQVMEDIDVSTTEENANDKISAIVTGEDSLEQGSQDAPSTGEAASELTQEALTEEESTTGESQAVGVEEVQAVPAIESTSQDAETKSVQDGETNVQETNLNNAESLIGDSTDALTFGALDSPQPDWEHVKTLKSKHEIKTYAATFGVQLNVDTKVNMAAMIEKFKVGVSGASI